jgi:sugar phosphate isomerase/epimerase
MWCAGAGFDSIDLPEPSQERVDALNAAGLAIGTIDLGPTQKLLSSDDAVRAEGIEEVSARVRAIAAVGGTNLRYNWIPESELGQMFLLEDLSSGG